MGQNLVWYLLLLSIYPWFGTGESDPVGCGTLIEYKQLQGKPDISNLTIYMS